MDLLEHELGLIVKSIDLKRTAVIVCICTEYFSVNRQTNSNAYFDVIGIDVVVLRVIQDNTSFIHCQNKSTNTAISKG